MALGFAKSLHGHVEKRRSQEAGTAMRLMLRAVLSRYRNRKGREETLDIRDAATADQGDRAARSLQQHPERGQEPRIHPHGIRPRREIEQGAIHVQE